MRQVRCPECGMRVRRDRLRQHRASVHRARKRTPVPLAVGLVVGIAVIAAALYIYTYRPPPEKEESPPGPTDPNAFPVQFTTEDGWAIKGTYYRGNESMPVVILVHGVGEDRKSWGELVPELRAKGYNILAYDSRGHGQSTVKNGRERGWQNFSDAEFQTSVRDLDSAKYYALSSFPSAPRIAIIGASIGANEALNFTAFSNSPEVKALVLLSPFNESRGIQSGPALSALNQNGATVAILFAASEGDLQPAATARILNDSYTGKKSLEMMTGGRHGTVMLTDPTFRTEILQFLDYAFKP